MKLQVLIDQIMRLPSRQRLQIADYLLVMGLDADSAHDGFRDSATGLEIDGWEQSVRRSRRPVSTPILPDLDSDAIGLLCAAEALCFDLRFRIVIEILDAQIGELNDLGRYN
jgi:hypothetical protein